MVYFNEASLWGTDSDGVGPQTVFTQEEVDALATWDEVAGRFANVFGFTVIAGCACKIGKPIRGRTDDKSRIGLLGWEHRYTEEEMKQVFRCMPMRVQEHLSGKQNTANPVTRGEIFTALDRGFKQIKISRRLATG